MVDDMIDKLKEIMRVTLSDDDFFKRAKLMREYYLSLMKEGFTKEEAILIVASQGAGIKIR